MTKEQYIKGVVSNLHCSTKKKKEIRQKLEAEIDQRMENGETIEEIEKKKGNVLLVAEAYNRTFSESEQESYRRKRVSLLVVMIIVLLFGLTALSYRYTAKTYPLSESKVFSQPAVEEKAREMVELLDAGKYDELQEKSSVVLMPFLIKETMDKERAKVLASDWGERKAFGEIVGTEMIQGSDHYATVEITVLYENVDVIYRVTVDPEMKYAGLNIRLKTVEDEEK